MDPISVTVERGSTVESVHRVHAVRVDSGSVTEAWGDHELVTFLRSAAKPFRRGAFSRVRLVAGEAVAPAAVSLEGLRERVAWLLVAP